MQPPATAAKREGLGKQLTQAAGEELQRKLTRR